jgi:hypothetical protein
LPTLRNRASYANAHRGRLPWRGAIACAVAFCGALVMAETQAANHMSSGDTQIVSDFEARVSRYVQARRKEAGSSPKPTGSPQKLEDTHQALAQKSQDVRTGAQQGDIFTPRAATYFRRQIAATMAGPQGPKIRASLKHAEPVRQTTLHVNEVYPGELPLQSTPASLLLNLPRLPEELQYRIVGNNLVLLDVAPKLVVDFVPAAIPSSKE